MDQASDRAERNLAALRRGLERSATYKRTAPDGTIIVGTVAVRVRGDRPVVGWHGLREDTIDFDQPDEEGETTFGSLAEAGQFLEERFGLTIGDLQPSRGSAFF